MNLLKIIDELVNKDELVDVSCESQAVFGQGILAVVSKNLSDLLTEVNIGRPTTGNSPFEEMFLDIKSGFAKQWCLKDVNNMRDFLAYGKEAYVAVLDLPDFTVLLVPLSSVLTVFVCCQDEVPEDFGIRL